MHTAAYKVDVASDHRRRENVPRHILCSKCILLRKSYEQVCFRGHEVLKLLLCRVKIYGQCYALLKNIQKECM